MLLAITPTTLVKIFDIHNDAKFHELYPDDEERAHREAAKAMEDCPFCHFQLSPFVVSEDCTLPQVPCVELHDISFYLSQPVLLRPNVSFLRAPPYFS